MIRARGRNPSRANIIYPNDARLVASDYQILSQTADRIRMTRGLVDGNGFEYCAPGGRVTFDTTATSLGITVYYNNFVTRDDARNFAAAVLIDGTLNSTFTGSQNLEAAETFTHTISGLSASSKTVTIVWPYADGMDLIRVTTNVGAVVTTATARPSNKIAIQGDSISQGFDAGDITKTWGFLLAGLKARQLVNIAYGGRTAVATDALQLAGTGADRVVYMIGFNNFVDGLSVASYQSVLQSWIANARASLPSAKIYLVSPVYTTTTAATWGHSIELQEYRDAMQAAETAAGDAETYYVDGLTLVTNNANRLDGDGYHLNDLGHSEMATNLASAIAA